MHTPFRSVLSTALVLIFIGAANPVFSTAGSWPATDGYPYYGQTIPFTWIEIASSGVKLSVLTDDTFYSGIPIGFSFPFYGSQKNTINISANGYVSFEGESPFIEQCPLPNESHIALMRADLRPNNPESALFYKTFAPCPGSAINCLVIQYQDWYFLDNDQRAGTFQAVLYQNGDIIIQFKEVGPKGGKDSGTGIETRTPEDWGLSYSCDRSNSLYSGLALKFRYKFLAVTPETSPVKGCEGEAVEYSYALKNYNTGIQDVTLTCSVSSGATLKIIKDGSEFDCSASIPFTNTLGQSLPFKVKLSPPSSCLPPGSQLLATLTANGAGYNAVASLNQTQFHSGVWDAIPPESGDCRQDSVPAAYNGKIWSITGYGSTDEVRAYDPATRTWAAVPGSNPSQFDQTFARSGCQHDNKVYIYGDSTTPGFTGLWSYNLAANSWSAVTPKGAIPPITGIYAPAWVYDSTSSLCYLTGGANSGDQNSRTARSSVYVFDPKTETWLPGLPNFSSTRDSHAAFIFTRPDGHKLLCVAGGLRTPNDPLSSTQCYDFNSGGWNGENANLGPLPGPLPELPPATWWGMGYAQNLINGNNPLLWLVAGVYDGTLSNNTRFFDVAKGTWGYGGTLISEATYRNSAVTLNNEIYKLGGRLLDFSQTCSADRRLQCSGCSEWKAEEIYLPVVLK